MGFVEVHLKIKNTVMCDFTSQIASQAISAHLKPKVLLRASCLTLETNGFRCYEAKIEESKKPAVAGSRTQDTSGLSCQCSATEPQQPTATIPHNPLYVLHKWY